MNKKKNKKINKKWIKKKWIKKMNNVFFEMDKKMNKFFLNA